MSSDPSEPAVSAPTAVPEEPGRLHDHPAPGVAVPDDDGPGTGRPFLFAGEAGTLRGRGGRARVTPRPGEGLADAVDRTLAETGPGSVVVGAVGFDGSVPPALVVPATRSWVPGPPADQVPATPTDLPPTAPADRGTRWDVRADPTPAEFATAVARALAMIDEGRVEKVVLSRSGVLTAPDPIDVEEVLARLVAHDPGAYAFRADISPVDTPGRDGEPDRDPDERTLLGASPELLLARRGRTVVSNPLAGTIARSLDPDEDARRAARLGASAKDLHEHALVVEQVAERLAPFCATLHVPSAPELSSTRALWHLSTRITGELADDPASGRAPNSLRLATALHPTAAICGAPTRAARDVIAELETVPRAYYTGLVGWCDDAGDGEWAVTIRCAQVRGRRARLHAGAGIVAGSSPEAEVAETSTKFRPLLAALGLEATP